MVGYIGLLTRCCIVVVSLLRDFVIFVVRQYDELMIAFMMIVLFYFTSICFSCRHGIVEERF